MSNGYSYCQHDHCFAIIIGGPLCDACESEDADARYCDARDNDTNDYPECGWCGEPIDYCTGHGVLNGIDPMSIVPDSPPCGSGPLSIGRLVVTAGCSPRNRAVARFARSI